MKRERVIRGRGARPLYLQLAEEILGGIKRGDLRPGDRVASEPELVKRHQVSRATAVRALEHLERTGVVRREQGKGTFVEEPRLVQRQPLLGSFTDQVGRLGHVATQRLVELGPLDREGETPPGSPWFGDGVELLRIVRLRLVDDEPVGLHTTALPCEIAERAGIDESAFLAPDASMYALLDAAGVRVVEAEEHLRAVPASQREAALLGLTAGTALMQVLRVSFGARGAPIEVTDARYAGERFDYSVSLVRPRPGARNVKANTGGNDESGKARGAGPDGERRGGRVRQVGRRGIE
jgi:GntR family transcriptional regulator, N-acetylglucosamine utilization regulator